MRSFHRTLQKNSHAAASSLDYTSRVRNHMQDTTEYFVSSRRLAADALANVRNARIHQEECLNGNISAEDHFLWAVLEGFEVSPSHLRRQVVPVGNQMAGIAVMAELTDEISIDP